MKEKPAARSCCSVKYCARKGGNNHVRAECAELPTLQRETCFKMHRPGRFLRGPNAYTIRLDLTVSTRENTFLRDLPDICTREIYSRI